MIVLKIKKNENATLPSYAKPGDAGLDLFATEDVRINAHETALIPTGIFIELPVGFEAQIRPRSGLARDHCITVLNTPGTIDSGYRGEIKVILINHSDVDYTVSAKDKIAQMVISPVVYVQLIEVSSLDTTERGVDGFGSSGKN